MGVVVTMTQVNFVLQQPNSSSAIKTARDKHTNYQEALQKWRWFQKNPTAFIDSDVIDDNMNGEKMLALWHAIMHLYRESRHGSLSTEYIYDNLGITKGYGDSDPFDYEKLPKEGAGSPWDWDPRLDQLLAAYDPGPNERNKFMDVAKEVIDWRLPVEEKADELVYYMLTGKDKAKEDDPPPLYTNNWGVNELPEAKTDPDENEFYKDFTRLEYSQQVAVAAELTSELHESKRGTDFLAQQFNRIDSSRRILNPFDFFNPVVKQNGTILTGRAALNHAHASDKSAVVKLKSKYDGYFVNQNPNNTFNHVAFSDGKPDTAGVAEHMMQLAANFLPGLQEYRARAKVYEAVDTGGGGSDEYPYFVAKVDATAVNKSLYVNEQGDYKQVIADFCGEFTSLFLTDANVFNLIDEVVAASTLFPNVLSDPGNDFDTLGPSNGNYSLGTAATIAKLGLGVEKVVDEIAPAGVAQKVLKPFHFVFAGMGIVIGGSILSDYEANLDLKDLWKALQEVAQGLSGIEDALELYTGKSMDVVVAWSSGSRPLGHFAAKVSKFLSIFGAVGNAASAIQSGVTAAKEWAEMDMDAAGGHLLLSAGSGLSFMALFSATSFTGIGALAAGFIIVGLILTKWIDAHDSVEWIRHTYFGRDWDKADWKYNIPARQFFRFKDENGNPNFSRQLQAFHTELNPLGIHEILLVGTYSPWGYHGELRVASGNTLEEGGKIYITPLHYGLDNDLEEKLLDWTEVAFEAAAASTVAGSTFLYLGPLATAVMSYELSSEAKSTILDSIYAYEESDVQECPPDATFWEEYTVPDFSNLEGASDWKEVTRSYGTGNVQITEPTRTFRERTSSADSNYEETVGWEPDNITDHDHWHYIEVVYLPPGMDVGTKSNQEIREMRNARVVRKRVKYEGDIFG